MLGRLAPRIGVVLAFGLLTASAQAQDPFIAVNLKGLEVKVKNWKFTQGARPVAWLSTDAKKPAPLALEFRDEHSTNYINGIATLIPLSRLKQLEYDHTKKTVTATVLTEGGKEVVMTGTTKFKDFNKILIEGEADLGDLGGAEIKIKGGDPADIIKVLKFPGAKAPVDKLDGRLAVVVAQDKEHSRLTAFGLTPIYQVGSAVQSAPHLYFRTTVKVDLDRIQKLRHLEPEDKKNPGPTAFEVALKDGAKYNLTLLDTPNLGNPPTPAKLQGLVGRVPAGYILVPTHTISEVIFDQQEEKKEPEKKEEKKEPEKDKDKDKDK